MSLKKPSELFEQKRNEFLEEERVLKKKQEEEGLKNKKIASPKELFGEVAEEVVVEKISVEKVLEVKIEDNASDDLTGFFEEKIEQQTEEIHERLKEKFEEYSEQFEDKTKKYYQNLTIQFNGIKENLIKKVSSLEVDILRNEQHLRNNNVDVDEIRQDINKTIQKIKSEIIEDVGALQEPPSIVTPDPLTPLDQNFVTFDHLNDHYRLFLNRIQQQLTTLGGGGEYRLQYLDDIVGIATNASAYDGKYLKYNHSLKKFEFVTVSGGTPSQTLDQTLALGNSSNAGINVGVSTFNNVVVGGSNTSLVVNGDVRITGILTVGTSSLTLDGRNNTITIGSGLTISDGGHAVYSGVVTATSFVGSGINLTGIVTSIVAGSGIAIDQSTGRVVITSVGGTVGTYATVGYVNQQISSLIGGSPEILDTLNEIASALNDDANFASSIATTLSNKLDLTGGTISGSLQSLGGFIGNLNGTASNATTTGYATNAGIATYATSVGIATYATSAGIATYATSAGIATYATYATYATNAGVSTYATSAGIATYATYATNAGVSTYATSAGIATYATYATNAGVSTYATSAGIATYATSAGIATYATYATNATNAGVSTYATSAGISTYATSAGIATYATYATNAGIATYATNAGISTYATSAGIATYATYATSAGIATYATYATNAGIATYATNAGIATYATNAGIATYATNAGIATYTSEWILGAVGSADYTFTGPGLIGAESDPTLYLIRGQQYKFTNTMGAHPFRIQSTVNGSTGTQYNDGITNNDVSNGTLTWNVQFDTPGLLYYQCTAHGGMGGKIYIIDAGIGPDISINTTGIITASSFSGNASSATYSTSAGIATYATNAGIATYATSAGVATVAQGLAGTPNITVGVVTATSFVKSGGTSSQFLKADGSVDSFTYATQSYVGLATVGLSSVSYVDSQVGLSTVGLASLSYVITQTGLATVGLLNSSGSAINLTGLTGSAANTYGNASTVPQIVVDVNGRITSITNVAISGGGGGGGTGLNVKNLGSVVGFAGTIDFGTGLSVTPISAGVVTVTATNAGIATYATNAGVSTYATSAGIATYATYATNAGIATYATSAGISTVAQGLTGTPNITVGAVTASTLAKSGGTSIQFLKADGSVDNNTYLTSYLETDNLNSVTNRGNTTSNNISVGIVTASSYYGTSYYGNGVNISGIVTSLVAGTNVSISSSTGRVTINASSDTAWIVTSVGIHTLSNVGIGTTNLTSTLTVAGSASITGSATINNGISITGITTISNGRIQFGSSDNIRIGNLPAGSGSGRNIAIGDQVLVSLSSGSGRNIGIGEFSYYDTTTGQYNIGIGERAGQKVTTGAYNVILGAYDGNTGGLDIRTSSNNVVIADGQGNIRQYINSSGNVGIKTTIVTEALTVAGVVSATSFYGTLNANQLTGTLPAIDGSNLYGVVASGTGIIIKTNGTIVGTAGTVDFSNYLNVSFSSGIATITGTGLATYATSSGIATYATSSGIATYATSSGIATYATSSGIATIAGYATTSGISSALTSTASVNTSGIITAASFSGSGTNLTNLPAGQLTGTLPAIDGSALLNINASGSGIVVLDNDANIGTAKTVNFGTGLDVTYSSGIATITASGGSLQSRTTVIGITTSITNNGIGNTNITGFKSYALMKVGLSTAGWLRIYTDSTSRTNDASRSVGIDPTPGSGVIAEVVTTGITTTQIITPFVMGGNLDDPSSTTIYAAITNLSGSTQPITANLTILQLEA